MNSCYTPDFHKLFVHNSRCTSIFGYYMDTFPEYSVWWAIQYTVILTEFANFGDYWFRSLILRNKHTRSNAYCHLVVLFLYLDQPWAFYQIRKIVGCAGCAANAGNVFPPPRISDPTCITARAWRTCHDACRDLYLAVSLAWISGGKNVPGISGACATRNFTYLVRDPCCFWAYRWLRMLFHAWLIQFRLFPPQTRMMAPRRRCMLVIRSCGQSTAISAHYQAISVAVHHKNVEVLNPIGCKPQCWPINGVCGCNRLTSLTAQSDFASSVPIQWVVDNRSESMRATPQTH